MEETVIEQIIVLYRSDNDSIVGTLNIKKPFADAIRKNLSYAYITCASLDQDGIITFSGVKQK